MGKIGEALDRLMEDDEQSVEALAKGIALLFPKLKEARAVKIAQDVLTAIEAAKIAAQARGTKAERRKIRRAVLRALVAELLD